MNRATTGYARLWADASAGGGGKSRPYTILVAWWP